MGSFFCGCFCFFSLTRWGLGGLWVGCWGCWCFWCFFYLCGGWWGCWCFSSLCGWWGCFYLGRSWCCWWGCWCLCWCTSKPIIKNINKMCLQKTQPFKLCHQFFAAFTICCWHPCCLFIIFPFDLVLDPMGCEPFVQHLFHNIIFCFFFFFFCLLLPAAAAAAAAIFF